MTPEQAAIFADEGSPAFIAGAFEVLSALWVGESKVSESFRPGRGVAWHDRSQCLFRGTERFFRPGYTANLVNAWLPALEGVVEKLERGARGADVGCGHGASTAVMARAFPQSHFIGFDHHPASVGRARHSRLRRFRLRRSGSRRRPASPARRALPPGCAWGVSSRAPHRHA